MTHTSPTQPRSHFAQYIALTGITLMLLAAGAAALYRSGPAQWLTPLMAALYIAWVLSEWRITTAVASQDTGTDRYTCETYASARFLTMLAALIPTPWWPGNASATASTIAVGFALFGAGVALRGWAITTLGRCYSHRVRTPDGLGADGSGIVSSGPYRRLRHPAYSGMLLAHVGIAVMFFNPYVVLALGVALLPALIRRIRVEEAHLFSLPGYPDFAVGRARLAPGVW